MPGYLEAIGHTNPSSSVSRFRIRPWQPQRSPSMFHFTSSDLKQTSQHLPVPFPLGQKRRRKRHVLMFSCHFLSRVINQLIIPSLCQSRAFRSVYHMPPCIVGWQSSQGGSLVRKRDLGADRDVLPSGPGASLGTEDLAGHPAVHPHTSLGWLPLSFTTSSSQPVLVTRVFYPANAMAIQRKKFRGLDHVCQGGLGFVTCDVEPPASLFQS